MNIAIVVSEFNGEVTSKMLEVALDKARSLKMNVIHTCKVPGVFDMPIIIDVLLKKKEVDAVVTLGAVIKGQTKHDELIAGVAAKALAELSLKYQKPVSLGITGPGMSDRQAHQRIRPVAERAVEAAQKIHDELRKI
ncbi:MAG: 6,7-dimethyl-8-ribityllumazine synthase [Patescibacteria group bacterium]|nr:6,7-dimethyl-8-ribityllumazine synthase [Nitrososphaerota archaeon]MDE2588877.1 6,7-dimethyl-8-ribityllumazine synthase [Patescibacteria group bacterium]